MATNFNKNNQKKRDKRFKMLLIIVLALLFIALLYNVIRYFCADTSVSALPQVETTITDNNNPPDIYSLEGAFDVAKSIAKQTGTADYNLSNVTNNVDLSDKSKSFRGIFASILALFMGGGSFLIFNFLKRYDYHNHYNISNSVTIIANNNFFYISLVIGIFFAFYISIISLVQNINISITEIFSYTTVFRRIYEVLAIILFIENYMKSGYSVSVAVIRTAIFLFIGIACIIGGYILGIILFTILVIFFVLALLSLAINAARD